MSTLLRIPQHRGSKCWPGRLTSWVVWLGLIFNTIPSAVTPSFNRAYTNKLSAKLDAVSDHYLGAWRPLHWRQSRREDCKRWPMISASGAVRRFVRRDIQPALLMIGGGAEWLYWCYAGKAWRAIAEEATAGCVALPPARAATLGLRRAALSALAITLFTAGVLVPSSIFSWPFGVQAGGRGSHRWQSPRSAFYALSRRSSFSALPLGSAFWRVLTRAHGGSTSPSLHWVWRSREVTPRSPCLRRPLKRRGSRQLRPRRAALSPPCFR